MNEKEMLQHLEEVRLTGITNMLNRAAVVSVLCDLGYYDTADYVANNSGKYLRLLMMLGA